MIAAICARKSSGALPAFSPSEEEQRQESHDRANHENVIGHPTHVPR
jgi:hypothetical protein